jgi:hypothetical protein
MFQHVLVIFREPFIYYKNIKLLRYNVVCICPGLITVTIVIESSIRTVKNAKNWPLSVCTAVMCASCQLGFLGVSHLLDLLLNMKRWEKKL